MPDDREKSGKVIGVMKSEERTAGKRQKVVDGYFI